MTHSNTPTHFEDGTDARRDTPSFHRNIEPIVAKLHEILPRRAGNFLEIASGSGQHISRFGREFPELCFQPTEYDVDALPSIHAWCEGQANIAPPFQLDVTQDAWLEEDKRFDVIYCSNVIHISPWEVTGALFKGAHRHLAPDGQLVLYGPYKINHAFIGEGDIEFEKWLKSMNEDFGIRDISDVCTVAEKNSLRHERSHPMPANNFIQVFTR